MDRGKMDCIALAYTHGFDTFEACKVFDARSKIGFIARAAATAATTGAASG
jgi:hypothetical protein